MRAPFKSSVPVAAVVLATIVTACNALFPTYEGVGSAAVATVSATTGGGGSGGLGGTGGTGGEGGSATAWWDDAFSQRLRIDIDVNGVADERAVPIYVRIDDTNKAVEDIAAGAADVRFVSADGAVLQHETVSWVEGTGGGFWVSVARIDVAHDHFWLYYDNPEAGAVSGDVYDDSTGLVYRLDAVEMGTALDASGDRDGSIIGSLELDAGVFDGAARFEGNDGHLRLDDDDTFDLPTGSVLTISMWLRTSLTASRPLLVKEFGCRGYVLRTTDDGTVVGELRTTASFCANHVLDSVEASAVSIDDDTWHHVALTLDRSGADISDHALTLFIDGRLEAASAVNGTEGADIGPITVGHNPFGADLFEGSIDDLRISHVARSEAWHGLAYRNGIGALLTVGPPESRPD